jgi:hypothetical protein
MANDSWRAERRVLVTDAHAMGSIGVIRSLGRAGYSVYAAADRPEALGLRSAYACRSLVYPSPGKQRDAFKDWLYAAIAREGISAIVPSESVLLAVRSDFDRVSALLPLSRDPAVVYAGMSKYDLFARFAPPVRDANLPPFLLFKEDDPIPSAAALAKLGLPVFLKADRVYARNGEDSAVFRCTTPAEAESMLRHLLGVYRRITVQGYADGIGVGAFLLRWKGHLLARFMHRRLHEVPHTGGASSYREAWWNEAICNDAAERLEALAWEGVGMFEYRWNPATGRFRLLEFNGRFWGSLHLALYAGVDFPAMLIDAFYGHEAVCNGFDIRTRSRWTFPRDVEYVWSRLKDRKLPVASRIWSVLEFFLLGLNPKVRSDLGFPRDRMLYVRGMWQSIRRWTRRGATS